MASTTVTKSFEVQVSKDYFTLKLIVLEMQEGAYFIVPEYHIDTKNVTLSHDCLKVHGSQYVTGGIFVYMAGYK